MRWGKRILFVLLTTILAVSMHGGPPLFAHDLGNEFGHIHIKGRLTTPEGNPIAGASVLWREGAGNRSEGGRIHPIYTGETDDAISLSSSTGSPLGSRRDDASALSRPGGSPIGGLDKNCLHRPPSLGGVRTMADGRYELMFLIKNEEACIRSINTLRSQNINVYLEKEGYDIRRKPGMSIAPPAGAPVPLR